MKLTRLLALLPALLGLPAHAELKPGDHAPDFRAQAAQAGKVFNYSLAEALKKGPVVLYFYPAAFTPGCTLEAHLFAEAIDQYQALGASVIGVSNDDIEKLQRFSVSECRGKFPVAADAGRKIMKAYDATMMLVPKYASRSSFVITPQGRIAFVYSSMSPDRHVEKTLAAVREWAGKR
jgi:peroxiredoxin